MANRFLNLMPQLIDKSVIFKKSSLIQCAVEQIIGREGETAFL